MILLIFLTIISTILIFMQQKKNNLFSKLILPVLLAILLAVSFSYFDLQHRYNEILIELISLPGKLYFIFMKSIAVPLIMTSLLLSLLRYSQKSKKLLTIISTSLIITGVCALITLGVSQSILLKFPISSAFFSTFTQSNTSSLTDLSNQGIFDKVAEIIPENFFEMFLNNKPTDLLSIIIFIFIFVILVNQYTNKTKARFKNKLIDLLEVLSSLLGDLVSKVNSLLPFFIYSLTTRLFILNSFKSIFPFLKVILIVYLSVIACLFFHLILVKLFGFSIKKYLRGSIETLIVSGVTSSSVATLPSNLQTQVSELNIKSDTASLSSSIGLSIGQNGCSGVYPMILIVLLSNFTKSYNLLNIWHLLLILLVIVVTSFGSSGVGGGALNSSIITLSLLGLPLEILMVMAVVDPVIDVARTILNVNGTRVVSIITDKTTQ